MGPLAHLNPATISTALGLADLVKGLNAFKNEVFSIVANALGLDIFLQSLTAHELIKVLEKLADARTHQNEENVLVSS